MENKANQQTKPTFIMDTHKFWKQLICQGSSFMSFFQQIPKVLMFCF